MDALAASPNAPPMLPVDCVPVEIVGSDGLNALADAPVSLAVQDMLPLRTPICRLICALFDLVFLHLSLFYPCICVAA